MRCNHDWRFESEDQTPLSCIERTTTSMTFRHQVAEDTRKHRQGPWEEGGRRRRKHRGSRRLPDDILDANVFSTCGAVSDGEVQGHQH